MTTSSLEEGKYVITVLEKRKTYNNGLRKQTHVITVLQKKKTCNNSLRKNILQKVFNSTTTKVNDCTK